MPTDRMPDKHWDLLVTELQGLQDDGQEALGGVDEMLIARYLASDCDRQERELVEEAARSFPQVRECIDLALQALGGALPELALPAKTLSEQSNSPRVSQKGSLAALVSPKGSLAAFRNWAVAASLLAMAAGGAYALARIKLESAGALAQVTSRLGKLQKDQERVARQMGAGTLAEVPQRMLGMQTEIQTQQKELATLRLRQDQIAARVGVDSLEGIPQKVAELQTKTKERDEQVASLRYAQERVAAKIGVDSLEAVPPLVSALQQSIKGLRAEVEDVGKNVVALKGSCGSCQSPTPKGNACVACYVPSAQPSPCAAQAPPCVCPPAPCSGGYAGPSQVSVGYPVAMAASSSYGDDGWRPASEDGGVRPIPPSSLVRAASVRITMPGASTDSGRWYALRPVTPGSEAPYAAPEKSEALTSATGTETNLTAVAQWTPAQSYTVARPVRQVSRAELVPVVRTEGTSARLVEIDNGGWQPARD